MAKGPNRFVPSGKLKALELREGSGIGVSNLLSGRFRYNEALNNIEYSENGGIYYTLGPNIELRGASADATPVELTTDGLAPGVTNRLFVPLGHAFRIRVLASAICVSGTMVGKFFSVEIVCAIKNISNTVSIVGSTVYDKYPSDSELTDCSLLVLADDVNKCLNVTGIGIVGGASNVFHWIAELHIVDNV